MSSVNKVFLMGHCGKDPEVRYLPSGIAMANVSIATSSKRKDKNTGELIEETQWHRVQFFDRLAEIVGQYVHKGSQIFIEGRLKYGKYEKDGHTNYTTDIVASELQLLGSPDSQRSTGQNETRQQAQQRPAATQGGGQGGYAGKGTPPQRPSPAGASTGSGFEDMDDDIPF